MTELIIALTTLTFSSLGVAKGNSADCAAATAIVKRYLFAEVQGKTLQPTPDWQELLATTPAPEPSGTWFVVRDTKSARCAEAAGGLTISLSTQLIGKSSGSGTSPKLIELYQPPKELVRKFELRRKGNDWKIESASALPPHVGLGASVQIYRKAIDACPKDATQKTCEKEAKEAAAKLEGVVKDVLQKRKGQVKPG